MPQIYHSDVIGSLLRPRYLTQARDKFASGELSAAEFKRIEDRAVDQAIAMQEGVGLDVITDGELRRFSFLDQIISELDGVIEREGAGVHFHNITNPGFDWHSPFTVTGKISQKRKLTVEEYAYSRARATKPVKVTLPSPLVLYSMWSPELSTPAYKDAYELFADAAAIVRAEAQALADLGCTYIQIDSPDYGTLVDPVNRELRENLGMPTERTLTEGADILNTVGDVPGVTFALHLCKGNYLSQWIGEGGYDLTAEALFNRLTNFDLYTLEYEDARSGSFEPLAKLPDDKGVILGLVSSKSTTLESPEELTARVHEAARYVGLERLGLSTQCGFSSVLIGANLTNEDVEERKLELVAEVAHQIW
ncbi:cobalamin-independent methionine synthase II family protein [Trebonia sp.]|uniref:cobalamin-independent methionine synthase II family protein n=1 Tax=Trebonia sp. TaxID=2767075 RepID=UPI0026248E52|nr:cobalamin-independent methionine synthase II family protein [Trebonia sp.]